MLRRTYATKLSDLKPKWHLVDADGQVLGRLASNVAALLKGKHNPLYASHLDTGDFVVVVNAKKIKVTGNKMSQKLYHHHSGYPGGIKSIALERLLAKQPQTVILKAVKGMLPKGPQGRSMLKKLKVYGSGEHPHAAQQPEKLERN